MITLRAKYGLKMYARIFLHPSVMKTSKVLKISRYRNLNDFVMPTSLLARSWRPDGEGDSLRQMKLPATKS